MTDAPVQHPAPPPATVADVMQPPVTTIEQNDHVAAAAYVMKRANASALIVTQAQTGQPIGIITDADVSRAVADGNNPNDVRIYELMTANPTVVNTTTSIRDAAEIMTSRRFRHLPVVRDGGLVGIVDITDVCRALLESGALPGPPSRKPTTGKYAAPPTRTWCGTRPTGRSLWTWRKPGSRTSARPGSTSRRGHRASFWSRPEPSPGARRAAAGEAAIRGPAEPPRSGRRPRACRRSGADGC
jgi:CBS domain-containing protein